MNYRATRLGALHEALLLIFRQPLALVLVVGANGIVLAVLALAGLAAWRAHPLEAPSWTRAQALVLVAGADGEIDLAAVGSALRKVDRVASAEFLGRDAALAQLTQRKSLASLGLAELRPNPLPDAFVVRFAAGTTPEAAEAGAAQLGQVKGVDRVEFQAGTYRKVYALGRVAMRSGLLLALALAAAALMAAALAGAIWVRIDTDALRLFDLLGAEPAALRRPFVYAGALAQLLAAALGCALVGAVDAWLAPDLAELSRQYALPALAGPLPLGWAAVFCLAAAAAGALIAAVAVDRARRRVRG
jgi:cell division protein FtsX